jgi:hypothetical protein
MLSAAQVSVPAIPDLASAPARYSAESNLVAVILGVGGRSMGCLLLILFLAFPRIALLLLYFFTNYLQRAYHQLLLPLLGFIFLPLTTLAYAWMANTGQPTTGVNLLILIVAVAIDIGGLGGGAFSRRRD